MSATLPLLLTIDDEEEFTAFVKGYFELRGFRIETAPDGGTGIAIAQRERPDIALVDMKMPGKHGDEVFRELRGMYPDLPVIMITASEGFGKTRQRMQDLGAYACFDKPIQSIKELEKTVREAIGR